MTQRDDPKPGRTGQPGDDFQKITGIGSAIAQRLWNAGVLTYDDLAQRNPGEIAAVTGISAERIASLNWTGQAHELAGRPPEAPDSRQHYATFHVEFLLESDNRVRRTKVHHHQTDAREAWAGWDDERLLDFLRARIPLPVAETPATPDPEPTHVQTPEQAPASAPARLADRPSPSAPDRPPSWYLSIEELAPIRGDQRSYTRGPGEPNSARLTIRFNPAPPLSKDTFDYSATIAARTFGGRDRLLLGTTRGTIRVSDPLSVEVTGPALPVGQYRLVATVDIYPADHSPEEPPLHSQGISGDLMRVAERVPAGADGS
jgi:hypothetical protein